MKKYIAQKMVLNDFRQFHDKEIIIGKRITAISGINGTGKTTILGLLANSSELKGAKRYDGRRFRSEFSELFKATLKHDPKGSNRVNLHFDVGGDDLNVVFRTTWQNDDTRFRVIPKWTNDGKPTESKIPIPSVYLGLSRLYPIGEAPDESVSSSSLKWSDPTDEEWFLSSYTRILSMSGDVVSVDSVRIDNIDAKRGVGIDTEQYNAYSNSSGQDNLGQILLAMLSFKKLQREMGEPLPGGLLVIDEIDASLHPAAQIRLIDLLIAESKETGIQVVFTTHSTVILKYLNEKTLHNPPDAPGDIEIAYITDADRSLVVKRNPGWFEMESDLFVGPSSIVNRVGVITEDDEARWFVDSLLKACVPDVSARILLIDASFGCGQIGKLYVHDYPYIHDRIVVFDGDVEKDDKFPSEVPVDKMLSDPRVLVLPGGDSPEKVIYSYIASAAEGSNVWLSLNRIGVTHRSFVENGPETPAYKNVSPERNKYKRWFNDNLHYLNAAKVVDHWVEDNEEEASKFCDSFRKAWELVSRGTV